MTDLKEYGRFVAMVLSLMKLIYCCCSSGRNYFLKEYVITRAIPIPRLLYAFGYYLVCP